MEMRPSIRIAGLLCSLTVVDGGGMGCANRRTKHQRGESGGG
jgi:hypothetical protein